MPRADRRDSGGAAVILICGAMLGFAAAAAHFWWNRPALPAIPPEARGDAQGALRVWAWAGVLAISFLLFIFFLTGSYLIVRFTRRISAQTGERGGRTRYVDAWRQYRISREEIDRVTSDEPREPPGPDADRQTT